MAKTISAATAASGQVTKMGAAGIVKVAGFTHQKLHFFPTKFVFQRMQALHRRAVANPKAPDAAKHLAPKKAAHAYAKALDGVMGCYLVAVDSARTAYFEKLLDVIASTKSLDGLETIFLSGLQTAGARGHDALFDRGAKLWAELGPPDALGGGAKSAVLFDSTTNRAVPIGHDRLQSLGPNGKNGAIIAKGGRGGFAGAVLQLGPSADAAAADGDSKCKAWVKVAGGVVGGVIGSQAGGAAGGLAGMSAGTAVPGLGTAVGGVVGAVAGALAGGMAGMAAGIAAGGVVGDLVCGDDSSSSSSEDDSSSQQESGSSGSSSEDTSTSGSDSGGDSGGDDGGDDGGGGDDDDGMPNPDDSGGMPGPDDPHGRTLRTDTYANMGTVAGYVANSGAALLLSNAPQFGAGGVIANAGFLASVPAVAAYVSATTNAASHGSATTGGSTVSTVATGAVAATGSTAVNKTIDAGAAARGRATGG